MIKDDFARCEALCPEQRTQLRQIALALRREQVNTMEQLCWLFQNSPESLAGMRSIGEKRMKVIEQVYRAYQAEGCLAAAQRERREGIL